MNEMQVVVGYGWEIPLPRLVSESQVVLIEPINHVKEGGITSRISLFSSLLSVIVMIVLDRRFAKIVVPEHIAFPPMPADPLRHEDRLALGSHVNRLVPFRLSRLE